MNMVQYEYAVAVAAFETTKTLLEAAEAEYMSRLSFVNENGEPVEKIYKITWDDELFENINNAFEQEHKALFRAHSMAYDKKIEAEKALVEYGLSLAPESIRDTLRQGVNQSEIKKQLMDIAFRLDTSDTIEADAE